MNEPIKVLNYFNMGGKRISKAEFLDNLIAEQPDIIEKIPILEIEYNKDGTKKEESEILVALKNRKVMHNNEKEIEDIYKCIVGHKYELEDVESINFYENNIER